jgi:hypothetical protein
MEEVGRRANLCITYEGTDISRDLAPFVTSFACTDNASGQADDLELTLQDRDGKWRGDWLPDKGAEITAEIECQNFIEPDETTVYPCGAYTVDELEFSGPPWKVSLRCVSSSVKKSLRREQKTRGFENTSLQTIAGQIAEANDLGLVYEAEDVSYTRRDQRKESDLEFLSRLADEAGLSLKVAERRIILFSGRQFDAKSPGLTYKPGDLASWRFSSQAHDVFRACKVSYQDPASKQVLDYLFEPESAPESGQVLQVNKRVESRAKAIELAKAELRKRNSREVTGSLQRMGDPRLFAGNTLSLDGFEAFSGTYFLEKVSHRFGRNGYTTSADIRKTLDY